VCEIILYVYYINKMTRKQGQYLYKRNGVVVVVL
jgi:hypothetical protein